MIHAACPFCHLLLRVLGEGAESLPLEVPWEDGTFDCPRCGRPASFLPQVTPEHLLAPARELEVEEMRQVMLNKGLPQDCAPLTPSLVQEALVGKKVRSIELHETPTSNRVQVVSLTTEEGNTFFFGASVAYGAVIHRVRKDIPHE